MHARCVRINSTRLPRAYPCTQGEGVFKPLDELLSSAEWPALWEVARGSEAAGTLRCICDVRSVGGDSYYRLSDARVSAVPPQRRTGGCSAARRRASQSGVKNARNAFSRRLQLPDACLLAPMQGCNG